MKNHFVSTSIKVLPTINMILLSVMFLSSCNFEPSYPYPPASEIARLLGIEPAGLGVGRQFAHHCP